MKSKYTIFKDEEKKHLIIREYAELDKNGLTCVCEESYADKMIKAAISKGSGELISALRTPKFYPAGMYAKGLAEAIIKYYQTHPAEPVEITYDDSAFLPKTRAKRLPVDNIDTETDDDDEVIGDDFDEEYEEKPDIKKINSSLSIVDEDEYDDLDDEK